MTGAAAIVAAASPWLAGLFGIGTAVFAERAFRAASQAEPPDRWRGGDSYFGGFDEKQEIEERTGRDSMRARAAALQSVATFLGAGAAVEAAAASQTGLVSETLVTAGIVVALGPSASRWIKTSREIEFTKAWYLRLKWSIQRKWIASQDPAVEDAAFAEEHPREASILKREEQREAPDRAVP
jgi:hypothetical protein